MENRNPLPERLLQVVRTLQPGWTEQHIRKRVVLDVRAVEHARIHTNARVEMFASAYAKAYARIRPNLLPEPERLALEAEARNLLLGEVA